MSMFSSRLGLALVVAALCLGGPTAHAQAVPLSYWIPGGLVGFGGGPNSNTYGNVAGFDGNDAGGGGFSLTRYNFSDGWFVGSQGGSTGLNMNGTAFGNFGSLDYQGVQFGYNFQSAHNLPVTLYAGFDTFKYNNGIGGALTSFSAMSSTVPAYGAHAGIEFKPTQNLSLSLGVGYIQQSTAYSAASSDINSSLMPAASLMATSGRR
jgi:hypothetical protein